MVGTAVGIQSGATDTSNGVQSVTHGDPGSEAAAETARELCHDLRQPVAAIAAIVAAAQLDAALPDALRMRLAQISAETRRISELCHHVLGDVRRTGSVRLDQLVANVIADVQPTSNVTVTFDVAPAVFSGDATALRRALWNLLENAVRAAEPAGRVAVDATLSDTEALLTVSDSGPGFIAGNARAGGLGLRIAARLAHENGGSLVVGRNERLGGAAVTVSLPRHSIDRWAAGEAAS